MTNIPTHEIAALARRQLQEAAEAFGAMSFFSSDTERAVHAKSQIAASIALIDLLAVDRRAEAVTYATQLWCEGPAAKPVSADMLAGIIAENGEA